MKIRRFKRLCIESSKIFDKVDRASPLLVSDTWNCCRGSPVTTSPVHLKARDVSLVTVSRDPIESPEAFKPRMDWSFESVSSVGSRFNQDFGVSFTQQEMDEGTMNYNYRPGRFSSTECPGVSSFYKSEGGEIFHTYSPYARGLENLPGIYQFLDLVPKGRGEDGLPYGMH